MPTARQGDAAVAAGELMANEGRRRAVIRTTVVLTLLALGVYITFIILAVTK